MKAQPFRIPDSKFAELQILYPNLGKNSDVGNWGLSVARLYLESLGATHIVIESDGIDIQAQIKGDLVRYEVKSTADEKISFGKLKVSSQRNHDLLCDGMQIMRVCKVGRQVADLYFLQEGRDFRLVPEARWRLSKVKKAT